MVSTFSLPRLMEEQISALVRAGHYSSKSDVVKDAMRLLLKTKTGLRYAAAIELVKEGKISLGRAAEIADLSPDEMQRLAEHHKAFREIRAEKGELERISETK
ncbi:MAG: UPF0175 family protein [Candidatus Micrarchaeota archaeon]